MRKDGHKDGATHDEERREDGSLVTESFLSPSVERETDHFAGKRTVRDARLPFGRDRFRAIGLHFAEIGHKGRLSEAARAP